ncbi:MAG: circadian clock protein KaiC [Bdellovibrionia bacterium]
MIKFAQLAKSATGIQGLDEITGGGIPKGRPTLICGDPGCGKTLFGMEFLVNGITKYNEPGVFVSFEELPKELIANTASLRFDLKKYCAKKKLVLEYVDLSPGDIEESGEYDLGGLFIRIENAIDSIGAKRVVIDTIEALFSSLHNVTILRAEVKRLFRFLKDKGVTTIITGERGVKMLTRQGLEEYISDCVILLDHRVTEQVSTRRLRVVKYRGTLHGTNEYPFLIDADGISVLPTTSITLDHKVSTERVSSGVPQLDEMMEGKGFYRGSSILMTGPAGTGKTSMAAHFARAAGLRNEKTIYFGFEESRSQLFRNMKSVGVDLARFEKKELLRVIATRPSYFGLEMHLLSIQKAIVEFDPDNVIIDPITTFVAANDQTQVRSMLMRLIDMLKARNITGYFTSLTPTDSKISSEEAKSDISSLIDTWILLRDLEYNGERDRGLYIIKSRGMGHSNQIREFEITQKGFNFFNPYLGVDGMLTGSARLAQAAGEKAATMLRKQTINHQNSAILRKRKALKLEIAAMQAELQAEEAEAQQKILEGMQREQRFIDDKVAMALSRRAKVVK